MRLLLGKWNCYFKYCPDGLLEISEDIDFHDEVIAILKNGLSVFFFPKLISNERFNKGADFLWDMKKKCILMVGF